MQTTNAAPGHPRDVTAEECLEALIDYRHGQQCRDCSCLDWALGQLVEHADAAVAERAARLRDTPGALHPCPMCRPCPPLDAVMAWLQSGHHTAEV